MSDAAAAPGNAPNIAPNIAPDDSSKPKAISADEVERHRNLTPAWSAIVVLLTAAAIALTVNQVFYLGFFVGFTLLDGQFLAVLAALLLPLIWLVFPAPWEKDERATPTWTDLALFAATIVTLALIAFWADESIESGWEYFAPPKGVAAGVALWAILIIGIWRTSGLALTVIVALFSIYPMIADSVPGPIQGFPQAWDSTAAFYSFSSEAAFGIPMRAFGGLVIGFVIFGVALQHTGAGSFFINIAFALLGHVRGGAAKVAIFSSGLLGSMSGSVITNVLTTGSLTIPTMKRTGFSSDYAAGVEACASTGGVLMPPVMGATAFVMASFLILPYSDIAIAAAAPSILYYFGLFLQIDAYAARKGLAGLPREELPKLGKVMKEGWHYAFSFGLLVWMLLVMKREAQAPYYAVVVLLATNQIFGQRLSLDDFRKFLLACGRILGELTALLAGIGLIVGALVVTGLAGTLATDLVHLAGGNQFMLLLMGAATSFVLGMGMTVTAAYIFLAVVLAPGLIESGLDPLGVHMFILYWGMLSFITPPVALGAFAAATLSGSTPMKAGFAAMKLGSIIYFIPFFFVLNPALIFHGTVSEVALVLTTALIGIGLIAGATQGWLLGWGRLPGGPVGAIARAMLFFAGLALAYPGAGFINHWVLLGGALVAVAAALVLCRLVSTTAATANS